MLALMFCAVISIGCGGGSDSTDPEQTESLNDNTGGDDTGDYDPNEESRGTSGEPVDLSAINGAYTAKNGETLTGKLSAFVKISVADGAAITLRDVTINIGRLVSSTTWAGLTCEGDATIILEGTNYVETFNSDYPAIYVPVGHTLTIKGTGALTADASGSASAGIGGGKTLSCGNIVIEGGTINAIGGHIFDLLSLFLLSSYNGAGIGGGYESDCGDITIKDTVTKVTATRGTSAQHSIGAGEYGKCGTVTIGINVGPVSQESYTYAPINLSKLNSNYIAKDGDILVGQLERQVKISVADGATVTLSNVTIKGNNWAFCPWAGLTCEGDATIILEGSNSVRGFYENYPGIHVEGGKTLTIKGSGSLDASSNGWGAGIGGGWHLHCGNIVIEGGTITATGGENAAGIGGGNAAPCGDITIKDTVIKVTAKKGDNAPYSVGAGGGGGTCGTVTIDGVVTGPIEQSPFPYEDLAVNLSKVTSAYTAQDGDILKGKLNANVKISVAHGATITLRNATIEGRNLPNTPWAGLTCQGDATLILEGTNYVKRGHYAYPAIHFPAGRTLTIKGSGALTADATGANGAGIGGGYKIPCGNIIIDGGTIIAKGGDGSAGIGGGDYGNCGDITITKNVTKVTATKGDDAKHSIGAGESSSCGTVTVGDEVGAVSTTPYTYPPDKQ